VETDGDVTEDWFGNPLHADGGRLTEPVPCPHCPAAFRRSSAFAAHLAEAHGVAARPSRPAHHRIERLQRWGRAQRFLSPWFFLPVNAAVTLGLWQVLGHDVALFSLEDPGAVLRGWIIRLSALPGILLLGMRVAG
jgi:uncharacterized C2H2 Zn-finger protein